MSKESIVNEIAALFADTFKELKEATEAQESAIREVNRVKNKQYDSAAAQTAALARANAYLAEVMNACRMHSIKSLLKQQKNTDGCARNLKKMLVRQEL